jgi:hypothetical protein
METSKQQHVDVKIEPQVISPLSSLIKSSLIASFSACVAESATIPMDTVKVRLQMQNNNMDPVVKQ